MLDQKSLQQFGEFIASEFAADSEVQEDGSVVGAYHRWTPIESPEPLDGVRKALKLAGMEPIVFKFQVYNIVAANPLHGGKVDLVLPPQLVIVGMGYKGMHQLDLVVKSPSIIPAEIAAQLAYHKRTI